MNGPYIHPSLHRRDWIKRGDTPLERRTPIRQANPERQAKKLKAYNKALKSKHAAELRELVRVRSQGICECGCGQPFTDDDPMQLGHKTYARRGHELPEDVIAQRRSCNLKERQSRAWYKGPLRFGRASA